MLIHAYKQAWTLPGSIDSPPIILDKVDGGRGCPSAVDMWTREVYEVLEQCVTVPGEISRNTLHYLEQQCIAHGCRALNQLQLLQCEATQRLCWKGSFCDWTSEASKSLVHGNQTQTELC